MREEINILLNVPSIDVLNEITEMINEKKLFIGEKDEPLTDKDLYTRSFIAMCTDRDLIHIMHDDIIIQLKCSPIWFDIFRLWQEYIECGVLLKYSIVYKKDGHVSHIKLGITGRE